MGQWMDQLVERYVETVQGLVGKFVKKKANKDKTVDKQTTVEPPLPRRVPGGLEKSFLQENGITSDLS